MFIFLVFLTVYQVQKYIRLFAFDFVDKVFGDTEPICDSIRPNATFPEVDVNVIVRTCIVFIVQYVRPMLDSRMLHTHFLYIDIQLIFIGYDFVVF